MKKKIFCIFYLLLLCPMGLAAQHYYFKNYTIEDGLPESQINVLFQDSKGYIWIGTNGGGLSKFNGQHFTNYSKAEGLSDNIIESIYEDRSGILWIGTNSGGVNKFNGKTFVHISTKNGLCNDKVWDIYQDENDNMLFATDAGLGKLLKGFQDSLICIDTGMAHKRIRMILGGKNNVSWLFCDTALCKYEGERFYNYRLPMANTTIFWSGAKSRDGQLWLGTYNRGFYKFNGKEFQQFNGLSGWKDNIIYALLEDQNQNLWMGTDAHGICKYDGKTITYFTEKEGLPNNRVRAIIQDREGNLWIGTEKGLCRFDGGMFTSFTVQEGLAHDIVFAILKDSKGNMWYGTNEGLSKTDGKNWETYTTVNGLPHNKVLSLCEDKQGNIWAGTYSGVCKIKNGVGLVKPIITSYSLKINNIIYALYCDTNNQIYVGTDGGLCVFEKEKLLSSYAEPNAYRIRCIIKDRQGNLWMGLRDQGVLKYDGKKYTHYLKKDGLADNTVFSITQDYKNNIWIATYGGGLTCFYNDGSKKDGTFKTYTIKDGLSNDATLSVISDSSNNLWIGTIKGLNRLDLLSLYKTGNAIFKYYGKERGFTGGECNQSAIYKDNNENIWIGTYNGVIKINTGKRISNEIFPPVFIENILVFYKNKIDTVLSDNKHVKLTFNKNNLTFNYAATSYIAPSEICYQYMLEGADDEWRPLTKTTFATYSSLSPGDYTFFVKACNSDGIWSLQPATFKFTITPPFWKQWWFYFLCIVLVVLTVYSSMKRYVDSIKRKREKEERRLIREIQQQKAITSAIIETQEQERKRIAEELHDGLGQVFSAIKLNMNTLEPLMRRSGSDQKNNFDTSLSLVDQAIKELRGISHGMMPSNLSDLGLVKALRVLCEKTDKIGGVKCNFIASGAEERFDSSIEISVYRITQELLNNILKHAQATMADVQLIRYETSLMLMVEDNGKGLKSNKQEGIGLENIKSRVQRLNGTFTIDSDINSGTSIVIEIPI